MLLNATTSMPGAAVIVANTVAPLLTNGTPNSTTPAANVTSANQTKIAAQQALVAYLHRKIHTLQLYLLVGYGVMFFLCVVLLIYLRFNRHVAFKGDESAARKVILPAFEPLLAVLAVTTGTYTIFFCTALATNYYTYDISKLATEAFYSGRQFVFLSVVVFMLQKSVSGPALRRSLAITFVLSTYTMPIVWYMVTYRPASELYTVLTTSRALLLLLYTYMFIKPPGRASKRTIREFCVFAYIYYALLFTYNELFRIKKTDEGFTLTYANLLCGSLCPLVIWRVLRADTEHWRGMGRRACDLQRLFRQNRNLPEHVSSKGLHVLIEMHRKLIIDFAYLELKQRIGVGASAIVFSGILKETTHVAVKVYTPVDFNEDTVAEFSQEAALCGALHHPNIVKFYGMCVSPPTICLVSELCQGSLEDVTCAVSQRDSHPNRQQMLLNLAYMLDAARAVAYIHSFSPPFVHRDIKPANFLVDIEGTVKLTDFGESRSLPRSCMMPGGGAAGGSEAASGNMSDEKAFAHNGGRSSLSNVAMMDSGVANLQHVPAGPQSHGSMGARMTVKGTVDYMAPEIIQGKAGQATYGEAADVYSLGITMWDILNPGREKFPTSKNNHFLVFENVTNGERPELDKRIHPGLRAVIESAWQGDAALRPSAQHIVSILESIQEEICAAFAMELSDDLENALLTTLQKETRSLTDQSFSGIQAIDLMEHSQYVDSVSEALRVGNALMDAGLLHHLKHARPFENSDALYFFDESNINLCKPLVVGAYDGHGCSTTKTDKDTSARSAVRTEAESESEDEQEHDDEHGSGSIDIVTVLGDNEAPMRPSRKASHRTTSTNGNTISEYLRTGASSSHSGEIEHDGTMCACRRLGQRLQIPKTSVRRRFRRKYKVIAEENVLAARLLQDEPSTMSHSRSTTGGGFHSDSHNLLQQDCACVDLSEFDYVDASHSSSIRL
uniref:Protein kinase domain-containing protein n=1 Tax=Globisporangium ultimum (strain ATCC 200006 / CBS 805.95 / DAOM BR144) TaxID=431595 RepID=K3WIH8_GLOUD